jgi:hypothetical protein
MAQNFKISIHRKIDNLYIRLMGDFDGSSAWELIKAIRENLNNFKFIQIDTSKLKKVYPFGREVFKYNLLNLKDTRIRIQFSGPNALRIAPHDTSSRRE